MNDKLKDIISTLREFGLEPVKEAVNHKIRNPLFGGFVISWIFFNWDRLLIIIFSKDNVLERISIVNKIPDNIIIGGFDLNHAHTFFLPALISISLTLFSPFIYYVLDLLHDAVVTETESNKFNRQAKILIAKSSLIDAEVENETQRETARLKVASEQELAKANIADSKANIETLSAQSKFINEQISINNDVNARLTEEIKINDEKLEKLRLNIQEFDSVLLERVKEHGNFDKVLFELKEKDDEIIDLKNIINKLETPTGPPDSSSSTNQAEVDTSRLSRSPAQMLASYPTEVTATNFVDNASASTDWGNALAMSAYPDILNTNKFLSAASASTDWNKALALAHSPSSVMAQNIADAASIRSDWSKALAMANSPSAMMAKNIAEAAHMRNDLSNALAMANSPSAMMAKNMTDLASIRSDWRQGLALENYPSVVFPKAFNNPSPIHSDRNKSSPNSTPPILGQSEQLSDDNLNDE